MLNPIEWVDPLGLARIPASVKQKVAQENKDFFGTEKCECCGADVIPGCKAFGVSQACYRYEREGDVVMATGRGAGPSAVR